MTVELDITQEARVRILLASALEDPEREWRLLNTLSLLEHIGSCKIFQSHSCTRSISTSALKHLAEETRHAAHLKKAAELIAGRPLGFASKELLGHRYARSYFNRLDALVTRQVGQRKAYENVSYIVEERALWFYNLYEFALSSCGNRLNLKGLIAEERRHLDEMAVRLGVKSPEISTRLASFFKIEGKLFNRLLAAMERLPA